MTAYLLLLLPILCLPLPSCSSHHSPAHHLMTPQPSLRQLAARAGVDFGAAVNPLLLTSIPPYAAILARECTVLAPENHMKMKHLQPQPGSFNFAPADALVAFAQKNHQRVFGHTLVWHHMPPHWLQTTTWSRAQLLDIMTNHITTVVAHFKGRVYAWDVVNEAIADSGGLRSSLWLNVIGPEYIDFAFSCAHQADPHALLFYNDYDAEALNPKSDQVYALVRGLKQRGVPIHGVGLQCHWKYDHYPPLHDVVSNISRLVALGLEVHISELDLRIDLPVTPEKLHRQALAYYDIVTTCLTTPGCNALRLWGITDAHSWVPGHFKGCAAPLPFDEHYQPKPAYFAIRDALRSLPPRSLAP
ncbi:MAG: endo-1,4-beta-xylanase [bacterium]|nr:endo-1,4-beta-xylanase [bacterium]